MKKVFILLLILPFYNNCYSQQGFETGYFINNAGVYTNCLIKAIDWSENPSFFEYRLTEDSLSEIAGIESVKEFGITGRSKYVRFELRAEWLNNHLDSLVRNNSGGGEKKMIFLKTLIEGKASLYAYDKKDFSKYFYSVGSDRIVELVTVKEPRSETEVARKTIYKQQLFTSLECRGITGTDILNQRYEEGDLVDLFIVYNKSEKSDYVNYNTLIKRDLFNLRIKPGINIYSLSFHKDAREPETIIFNNENGFRIGIEAEMVMPWFNYKWAILLEPSYQYYRSQVQTMASFYIYEPASMQTVDVEYNSIDLNFGIRRYLLISNNSGLSISGLLTTAFNVKSGIDLDNEPLFSIPSALFNPALVLGYEYKKFSLELKYIFPADIIYKSPMWSSDLTTFSAILGFNLF